MSRHVKRHQRTIRFAQKEHVSDQRMISRHHVSKGFQHISTLSTERSMDFSHYAKANNHKTHENRNSVMTSPITPLHQTTMGQHHYQHTGFLCKPKRRRTVQQWNNRGCVNLAMGNFAEANHFFELAMKKHQIIAKHVVSLPSSGHNDYYNLLNAKIGLEEEFQDYDCYNDYDISEDMEIDLDSTITSTSSSSSSSSSSDGPLFDTPSFDTASSDTPCSHNSVIQRITTSSTVRTSAYCGMHSTESGQYRQVYCLPIVMDNAEWESASMDDKTFVLIFNSAICNHLWGMHFQEQEDHNKLGNECGQSTRAFLVADSLYRLALGSVVSRNGNNSNQKQTEYQFYLLAVLNNLSHISCSLNGSTSCEARHFDQTLLKAIFWYRDLRVQRRSRLPNHSDRRDEDDEIVALFLDYVFYLIGPAESVLPAAAA